jgi:hypothetical protein
MPHEPRRAPPWLSFDAQATRCSMNSAMVQEASKDRRLTVPFVFTVLPAVPIFGGAVYLIASSNGSILVMAHPLAPLWVVVALLLIAIPIRLANHIYSLRESSPIRKKLWAAIQCAVPAAGVFVALLAIVDQGLTVGRFCLLAFFGCYLVALIALLLHVIHAYKKGA